MKKNHIIISIVVILLLMGCSINLPSNESDNLNNGSNNSDVLITEKTNPTPDPQPTAAPEPTANQSPSPQPTSTPNPAEYKPNEAGRVMIVMFHKFVETFTPTGYDDGEFTMTFSAFEELLETLYERNYRLISLRDFLDNNISVPAGFIPIVFTFDDGSSGQFNLIEENGVKKANPKSAVGILEEFNRKHPDFGLEGTFYVNLDANTFMGEGTLSERLEYLVEKGFEIGNHTLSHIDLWEADQTTILKEVGGNQKRMNELIDGYLFDTLALPLGNNAKEDLRQFVIEGEYDKIKYKNRAIMRVGWDPTYSPVNVNFDPLSTHRVRSPGINPVDFDLNWWLDNLSLEEQYISDGNPDTVTVPAALEQYINKSKLKGKELILY